MPERDITVLVVPKILKSEYVSEVRVTICENHSWNNIMRFVVNSSQNSTDSDVIWWIHESELAYVQMGRKLAEMMPWTLSDNVHVYWCRGLCTEDAKLLKDFQSIKLTL